MEIDFLGLNSKYSSYNLMKNDQNSKVNPFTGLGVDVSLSLGSNSTLVDSQTDELPYISSQGYTPTVAMARRATLARFLQKRSHRLTQTRAARLSLNVSEAAANIKSNNKKNGSSFVV
ncbi:uncharacterized protein [Henckelia pumila]|uniref:uncharacterized protein n=1 Tax=Henckelia pumila TaxID=405737 RepID=UPI003C6E9EC0